MFKDFIDAQVGNDNLKVGSVEWTVPSAQVDGYLVEGYMRLQEQRPALQKPLKADQTYPVGSKQLCVKATEDKGFTNIVMWVEVRQEKNSG